MRTGEIRDRGVGDERAMSEHQTLTLIVCEDESQIRRMIWSTESRLCNTQVTGALQSF